MYKYQNNKYIQRNNIVPIRRYGSIYDCDAYVRESCKNQGFLCDITARINCEIRRVLNLPLP